MGARALGSDSSAAVVHLRGAAKKVEPKTMPHASRLVLCSASFALLAALAAPHPAHAVDDSLAHEFLLHGGGGGEAVHHHRGRRIVEDDGPREMGEDGGVHQHR